MSEIILSKIDKYYGKNHVLKSLDLKIENGEFMTLLGPSGCGKTTTLRIIAGLEKPQNGVILMDGREVVNAENLFFEAPDKRKLSLVFQSYALWPHLTVFDNVAFSMTVEKRPKGEIKQKVANALDRMRITEFAERYPSELSGGQQQRVAIASAIVNDPSLLLLDEPLSNLDAKLRVEMRSELKRLHHELGTTIVYVTHDQVEALTMSTRIAVFFDGVLEQVDTPLNLYQNPKSLRVADFIGNPSINFIEGKARFDSGKLSVDSILGRTVFGNEDLIEDCPAHEGEFDVVLGIRPEKVSVSKDEIAEAVPGVVYTCQPAGSETIVNVRVGDCSIISKDLGLRFFEGDEKVWVKFDNSQVNVFDKRTGLLIKRTRIEEALCTR